ncbi:hypothetical protein E1B28_003020 [Marasmius oreades]|uniref:Protein kinase domain-containing protein n=1 Tax=Marasmius oreades TaxID=181124 RepID=A0A9P7UN00_9AGAR|nr:uncharacterized protein E1B28_003020 [Marasmius oreades]KAG7085459.1 hypothetical protein E1B28_003020 [Marasmius oreades]
MTPVPSNEVPEKLSESTEGIEEDGQELEVPAQSSQTPVTPPARQGAQSNIPHETPVKYSGSSYHQFTSMHYVRDARYGQAETENRGKFISMDPEEFLDTFLPAVSSEPFELNATAQQEFVKAAKCKREKNSYKHLCEAISEYCPSLEIIDTSKHPTTITWGGQEVEIKPDLSSYLRDGDTDKSGAVDIDKVEVTLEGKWTPTDDGFDDNEKNAFERDSGRGRDTRGQITAYATAQLARQHRTHCFSILFVNEGARLIRWDRAGAIVTKKFSYVKSPWLAMFFHRYNFASPSVRGVDTSVEKLLAEDPLGMQAQEALGTQSQEPLYKFMIVDDKTDIITYYIGSKPTFNVGSSFTGRCTRCYKVYDVQSASIVFMKDTWRVDEKDMMKEGDVYRLLQERGVANILTLITYGDVRQGDDSTVRQTTRSQLFAQLRGHCHARLVFKEIGRDLTHFDTTGEIVSAISDAMQAHQGAYQDAKIIHRDVSVGNILILADGKGVLIDWDLSKSLEQQGGPRQKQRTGTWQFMSAKLLANTSAPVHELADDLESFYHVLVWVVLRFTPHPMAKRDLMELLQAWFDEAHARTGDVHVGGKQKGMYFESSYIRTKSQLPEGELRNLIVDLEAVLRIRYAEQPQKTDIQGLELLEEMYSLRVIDERVYRDQKNANPAWKYTHYTERLTSHAWMVSRFRQAASLRSRMLDGRVVHDVTASDQHKKEIQARKRSSELECDQEDQPPARRRKLDRAAKDVVDGYRDEPIVEEDREEDEDSSVEDHDESVDDDDYKD